MLACGHPFILFEAAVLQPLSDVSAPEAITSNLVDA